MMHKDIVEPGNQAPTPVLPIGADHALPRQVASSTKPVVRLGRWYMRHPFTAAATVWILFWIGSILIPQELIFQGYTPKGRVIQAVLNGASVCVVVAVICTFAMAIFGKNPPWLLRNLSNDTPPVSPALFCPKCSGIKMSRSGNWKLLALAGVLILLEVAWRLFGDSIRSTLQGSNPHILITRLAIIATLVFFIGTCLNKCRCSNCGHKWNPLTSGQGRATGTGVMLEIFSVVTLLIVPILTVITIDIMSAEAFDMLTRAGSNDGSGAGALIIFLEAMGDLLVAGFGIYAGLLIQRQRPAAPLACKQFLLSAILWALLKLSWLDLAYSWLLRDTFHPFHVVHYLYYHPRMKEYGTLIFCALWYACFLLFKPVIPASPGARPARKGRGIWAKIRLAPAKAIIAGCAVGGFFMSLLFVGGPIVMRIYNSGLATEDEKFPVYMTIALIGGAIGWFIGTRLVARAGDIGEITEIAEKKPEGLPIQRVGEAKPDAADSSQRNTRPIGNLERRPLPFAVYYSLTFLAVVAAWLAGGIAASAAFGWKNTPGHMGAFVCAIVTLVFLVKRRRKRMKIRR